ncbi:MAG TPA: glycogen synthase [Gemmatimonadales bacterium]|nr:glycogen synthase [Gemmatimonadales bacterium]
MDERRSPARGQFPHSALQNAAGEQVTVIHLAAEYYPYARSGGLAEAVANLARFQSNSSVRSLAVLPLYRSARNAAGPLVEVGPPLRVSLNGTEQGARLMQQRDPRAGTRVYFIEADQYFDRERLYGDSQGDYADNHQRYAFFTLAALEALPHMVDGAALLHVHDWHAALALVYLRTRYAGRPFYDRVRTVLSVHNAGYQGHYPPSVMPELGLPWNLFNWRQLEWYGKVNFLKGGLVFADRVVTVSPNHAKELRTPAGGFGLQEVFEALGSRFSGILNGIDQQAWDPTTDPLIPAPFSITDPEPKAACKREVQRLFGLAQNPRLPLFAMAARLVTQKGISLMIESSAVLSLRAQFIFIGAGEARFEQALGALAARYPERIAVNTDFTDRLEHLLMAGADFLLMPCQYEPCGLTQMRSQRYGAIPVVRRVGGLADTVEDGVTGFVFEPYHADALLGAALRGLDCYANGEEWTRLGRNAMSRDFSWELSVERYLEVYRLALA